jgi:hypothetical protein
MRWCIGEGILWSYFSCSSSANDQRDLPCLFTSLAVQLAQQHPKARLAFTRLARTRPHPGYGPSSDQVEQLVVKQLKSADVPAVIVIDGLGEGEDGANSRLAILSSIEKWTKEVPKVKFLTTSRLELGDLARLNPPARGPGKVFSLHDIPITSVNEDIRTFIEHELSGLASRRGIEYWPTKNQLDLLCDRAAGVFVYAVATVKFLAEEPESPVERYAVIERSPDDTIYEGTVEGVHKGLSLDSFCTSSLQTPFKNIPSDKEATVRSVLATMALATLPLSPSTIADLTRLRFIDVMFVLESIQPLLRLQRPDQSVHPFHKLLSDSLTSPTRCADKKFYLAPEKFHSEIALNCLNLMSEAFGDSFLLQNRTADQKVEYLAGKTALNYACANWHIHLVESGGDVTTLLSSLRRFLEENFTVWLEVLGVLKAPTNPVFVLTSTTSWLREVYLFIS